MPSIAVVSIVKILENQTTYVGKNLKISQFLFSFQLQSTEESESSCTFVFEDEGHTLGNVLKSIIGR